MMISESLWVGKGPESSTGTSGVLNCATAKQAADAIKANYIAVVPTTDVAHDAILAMGYGQAWATFATKDRNITPDDVVSFLF
jgi:hypothetical protein